MNTIELKRPVRPTDLVDGLLILAGVGAVIYSVVAIVIGFRSTEEFAMVAVIIGGVGLAVFLPGLTLLLVGFSQRLSRGAGDRWILAGRIALAVPVALVALWVLPDLFGI